MADLFSKWTEDDVLAVFQELVPEEAEIGVGETEASVVAKHNDRSVTIYWDESDPAEPGWAWRTRDASGDDDSGPLDDAAELVALAHWLAEAEATKKTYQYGVLAEGRGVDSGEIKAVSLRNAMAVLADSHDEDSSEAVVYDDGDTSGLELETEDLRLRVWEAD